MLKGFWTLPENGVTYTYTLSETLVEAENEVSWCTRTIKQNDATFFLRLRKLANNYQMEVVMKGSESDCQLFSTKISILDYNSEESVFKICFNPRPISTEKWGTFCLLVPQEALARICQLMYPSYLIPSKELENAEDDGLATEDDTIVTEHKGYVFFKVKVTIKESIKKLKPSVKKSKYSLPSTGMFVG